MKAMILAAGRGKRLRPITDITPKPLVKVQNKALIEYQIMKLRDAGITDIIVNYAWLGDKIIEFLGDGTRWGVNLTLSDERDGALETAGGIIKVLDFFDDEPFLVVSSDIYSDMTYLNLPSLDNNELAHLFLVDNPEHNSEGDFCLEHSGKLCSEGISKYTYANVGLYRKALFAGLPKGPLPLAPLLRAKMAEGSVSGTYVNCFWTDVGTPNRLNQLEQKLAESC